VEAEVVVVPALPGLEPDVGLAVADVKGIVEPAVVMNVTVPLVKNVEEPEVVNHSSIGSTRIVPRSYIVILNTRILS
jgi:hypothetical protein